MTIHFLGKWPEFVASAKAGFDVADANFFLKGDEGCSEGSRGITLNKKPIRADFAENSGKSFEDAGGEFERSLIVLHKIQIVVGSDGEDAQHLVEHVTMLRGYADVGVDLCRAGGTNDRRHFDGFRSGTENGDDAHELF